MSNQEHSQEEYIFTGIRHNYRFVVRNGIRVWLDPPPPEAAADIAHNELAVAAILRSPDDWPAQPS